MNPYCLICTKFLFSIKKKSLFYRPSDSVKFNEEISEKSLIHFIIENSSEETKHSVIKVLCSLVGDEEIRNKCNK